MLYAVTGIETIAGKFRIASQINEVMFAQVNKTKLMGIILLVTLYTQGVVTHSTHYV
jgi:hypothetical protein